MAQRNLQKSLKKKISNRGGTDRSTNEQLTVRSKNCLPDVAEEATGCCEEKKEEEGSGRG